MIVAIGEILFDEFPMYRRLGGAPFNFAYHLRQLGADARLVTRIGRDEAGDDILERLDRAGFDLALVQIDEHRPTGRVRVDLDPDGTPHFSIERGAAYDAIACTSAFQALAQQGVELVYIGSLSQRTPSGAAAIHAMLDRLRETTRVLYDMNLRPECDTRRIIEPSLRRADILKLNGEELARATDLLGIPVTGAAALDRLMTDFGIATAALTLGGAGSLLVAGDTRVTAPAGQVEPMVDTVGAGDAYAALLAGGLLAGRAPQDIIAAAARFAADICRGPGALPSDERLYAPYRRFLEGKSHA